MKRILIIEKVMIHNENMDLTGTKTRVKVFGKEVLTYNTPNNNQLITA
ncbi:hypothetical protein [Flavobacterium sandaracinum]|nr:hypothetical protein [Flavobacterium sandaracinum]